MSFVVVMLAISFLTLLAVFPYSLIDKAGFLNSMNYETGVGRGTNLVFYTRQFINTDPLIFQFKKILLTSNN